MRSDITKASGLWRGVEIEHTQFKGMETVFVSRASALGRPNVMSRPHIYIDMDDPQFWDATEIGWQVVREWLEHFLVRKFSVTLGTNPMQLQANSWLVADTSDIRRRYPNTFCLLVSVRIMCPDLKGYAVKVVPYAPFADQWAESGVLVRTADEFEKGKTLWAEYLGDKDLP